MQAGVAPIEYQLHKGCIKVSRQSTIVYKMDLVPTCQPHQHYTEMHSNTVL